MAGLNVGTSNLGSFRGMPELRFNKPKPKEERQGRRHRRYREESGIDTGPSKPPAAPLPRWSTFGGMLSNQDILPSTMDPYRTYGNVFGGRMTPPSNPYGQNQPIRFTPGGEYGPINSGPTQVPPMMPPPGTPPPNASDYMGRGGFTGNSMPYDITGGGGAGGPSYMNPGQANIPNMRPGRGMFGGGSSGGFGGLRSAYGNRF